MGFLELFYVSLTSFRDFVVNKTGFFNRGGHDSAFAKALLLEKDTCT